jgi:hypothetical protein
MKRYLKISSSALLITILFFSLGISSCQPTTTEKNETIMEVNEGPQLRHVVLFQFKPDADPAAIKIAEDAFLALPSKIPQIQDFEWGLNNSPEGLEKGFTHCYFLTFASEEDRGIYLPHPDHKAFGALLDGILGDVLVVDYWAN